MSKYYVVTNCTSENNTRGASKGEHVMLEASSGVLMVLKNIFLTFVFIVYLVLLVMLQRPVGIRIPPQGFRRRTASSGVLMVLKNILVLFITCLVLLVMLLRPVDGLSWEKAEKHIYVKHGNAYKVTWHYRMERNETFLSSDIDSFEVSKPHKPIALRHGEENTYEKYQKNDNSFSVSGKDNVTLTVDSAEIGRNINYCLVVRWISVAGINKSSICSEVSVYDVPQITHHIAQLSCKQGDSIKLKCNATGMPTPHVSWWHDETHSLVNNSSAIVLNITCKKSEGRYCCVAENRFGNKTACTFLNVTEYEPVNTTLLVNQLKRDDVYIIHIKCKAVASPSSNRFIIRINDENYTSSNGVETLEVPAPRKRKIYKIVVSCIPYNKYGQGPIKEIAFPLYAPPVLIAPICTQYNMTGSSTTLKCEASGNPTPNITWTSGDTGDIVGTGEFYNVSHEKCATKTMKFFCHARNAMGNVSSPEIHVKVLTTSNCSKGTADKGLDQWIVAIIVLVCIIIIIVVIAPSLVVLWWRKRKLAPKDPEIGINGISEDPCPKPDDAFVSGSNATATEEDPKTAEECHGILQTNYEQISEL